MRNSMPSTLASAPSSSGAVEAPVQTPIRNARLRHAWRLMRSASATGTALG